MKTHRNGSLNRAKKNKNDEFYTLYEDIEKECNNYRLYFRDKIIYCCCDSKESNFYKYFRDNFYEFGLKELWCTSLDNKYIKKTSDLEIITDIDGNMFSEDCLYLLRKCDILITNLPFSEFRQFFDVLMEYDKDFIIVVSNNSITYKNVFPRFKDNTIRRGYNNLNTFNTPNGIKRVAAVWYTTFPVINNKWLDLTETFSIEEFPKYDNYIAWNVDKTKEIPMDREITVNLSNDDFEKAKVIYNDDCELLDIDKITGICKVKIKRPIWGVPISFIDKYNPEQFEIFGVANHGSDNIYDYFNPKINSKQKYARILIRQSPLV